MLSGDPNPWRDIGHSRWYDPYAQLEDTSRPEFAKAIQEESVRWDSIKKPNVAKWEHQFSTLLSAAIPKDPEFAQERIIWQGYNVRIQHTFAHRLNVWIMHNTDIIKTHFGISEFGVDPESLLYFIVQDTSHGAENLELCVCEVGKKMPIWTHANVGPGVAFKKTYLYFQSVENTLRYPAIYRVQKTTGREKVKIFEEKNKKFQVQLLAPPRQSDVFIHTANALAQRIGRIDGIHVRWMTPPPNDDGSGTTLIPISASAYATNTHLVIENVKHPLPFKNFIADAVLLTEYHVLVATIKQARSFLHIYDIVEESYTTLFCSAGPSAIMIHRNSSTPTVAIATPNDSNKIFEIQDGALQLRLSMPTPVALPFFYHGYAGSKQVPYSIVSAVKSPKKLIVEGYGAYGITGKMSYPIHWLPWLANGYALAVACPRGGRDNGDDWYDQGRTALRKHNTFHDTASVIEKVQKRLHISPKHTIFYGRSAGGWLAAIIAQQFPHLVGAVYAEVPYLDVLRTTSNPKLPLTQLEYDEFGNPTERPDEFAALQTISPIDSAALAPAEHSPFILARTAVNDVQVLPYEALKWAKKLRGLGWTIVVGVDSDGGHFAPEKTMFRQLAEDAAILDSAVGNRRSQTRKLRSHKSRRATLRRTSSKKH